MLTRLFRNVIATSQFSYKLKHNPSVQVPIIVNGQPHSQITIELFQKLVPKTVDNFLKLLPRYQNSLIYKLWPGLYLQSGDITQNNGKGGVSATGRPVKDQSFMTLHDSAGLISMVSNLNDINSKFILTLGPCAFFDYRYVAFGKVLKGLQNLRKIQQHGSQGGLIKSEIRFGKFKFIEAEPPTIMLADGTGHQHPSVIYKPTRNY